MGYVRKSLLVAAFIVSMGFLQMVPAVQLRTAYGYSEADLKNFLVTNKCHHCDLYDAPLSEKELKGADLSYSRDKI